MYEEALERGLAVNEAQLESQWETARRQLAASGDQNATVEEKLARSGYTEKRYKAEIRKESLVRILRQKLTPEPDELKDDEIDACYQKYKDRFRAVPRVHFRELLVALAPIAGKNAVDDAHERIKTIKALLDTGTSFETLVREHSDARSARAGGASGWKTWAKLGEKAADLAFSLKPGEVGGPLETTTGFVLIELIEKQEGRYYTVEEARDSIVSFLRRQKRDNNVKKLVAKLRQTAKIEYVVRP